MEHEMRLAVLPAVGISGPMVMPYCIGCGWVGRRRSSSVQQVQSVPADWRTHIKEFNESEDRRIAAWLEHRRARAGGAVTG
jgi:hypothetical protein